MGAAERWGMDTQTSVSLEDLVECERKRETLEGSIRTNAREDRRATS
jgi:hypothetical protein